MAGKLKYLNVGCGSKFHPSWQNVDMVSRNPDVLSYNLFKGIPFPDNTFEVVYQSQVLEHFPKEKALPFLKECYRVLQPGGNIRIVTPDLENIVTEYLRLLRENMTNPSEKSEANYEWIMVELLDQSVRSYCGGHMAEYLMRKEIPNEEYVIQRLGAMGKKIRNDFSDLNSQIHHKQVTDNNFRFFLRNVLKLLKKKSIIALFGKNFYNLYKLGSFRMEGEIHMWMYDKYSLTRLLQKAGFSDIAQKDPYSSQIPQWESFELDVKDGVPYDPKSLFMEAIK